MLKMKTVYGKTIINDNGYITEYDTIAEAFQYVELCRLIQEVKGTLPTEKGGVRAVTTRLPKIKRFSVDGVPI